MSDIRDFARDALQAAQADLAKARHALPLAAGILALIHLLTVHPYIQTAREIAGIETRIAANASLLAGLDPDIAKLQATAESAGTDLQNLLAGTTEDMIGRFARLRELVRSAMAGETTPSLPDEALLSPEEPSAPPFAQMRQMPMNMPQMQMNMPQTQMNLPQMARPRESGGKLSAVLAAIAAKKPDAMAQLTEFARTDIVAAAYRRAQENWQGRIQPRYMTALEAATASVRAATAKAGAVSPDVTSKLSAAADNLAQQRTAIAAVVISPDNTVDAALGGDWWRTVEGKAAFADALADSVKNRMHAITMTASAPADALHDIQLLQQELRDGLVKRQQALEEQFSQHREQLATLSGTTGVIPVDLASFIGLFPLVIGIVLGALLLRSAQARRQAALAADGLAQAAPEDAETRNWLVLRTLDGNPAGSWIVGFAIAITAVLWIALAGWHVAAAPNPPPLPPWLSSLLGVALIMAATTWDLWSVRRLTTHLKT